MSSETKWTAGPWSTEAFNEVIAGTPDYGAMILGADGETIVAQCVAERDVNVILAAPDTTKALRWLVAVIDTDDRAGEAIPALEAARAALRKAAPTPKADTP